MNTTSNIVVHCGRFRIILCPSKKCRRVYKVMGIFFVRKVVGGPEGSHDVMRDARPPSRQSARVSPTNNVGDGVDVPPGPPSDDEDNDDENVVIRYKKKDLLAIMLAMKVTHKFSDDAFTDMMRVLNIGCTSATKQLPDSNWSYKKKLEEILPVKEMFVSFCDECNVILEESAERIKEGTCHLCEKDLHDDLKAGRCLFVKFSIRDQIEAYFRGRTLGRLMQSYEPHYRRLLRGCSMYDRHFRDGNITLSMFMDTANLTRRYGVKFHPCVLFINNIPVASQLRFPILAGMFCCEPPSHFPSKLLAEHVQEELREMRTEPVQWVKKVRGERVIVSSHVFLTMCVTDAVEKKEFLCQVGHGGFFSCPYCEYSGERITRARYPDVWRRDMLRFKIAKDTVDGRAMRGIRFSWLVHHARGRVRLRSDQQRLQYGTQALRINELHLMSRGRRWRSRVLAVRSVCTE